MFGKSQCKSAIHRRFVFVVIPCNGNRSVAAEKQNVASLLLAREAVPTRMKVEGSCYKMPVSAATVNRLPLPSRQAKFCVVSSGCQYEITRGRQAREDATASAKQRVSALPTFTKLTSL